MAAGTQYAELEIGLYMQGDAYEVELRFTSPLSDAQVAPVRGSAAMAAGDLLALRLQPDAYGKALAAQVFADADVRAQYGRLKTAVETGELSLRVRVYVSDSAAGLQHLRWELLTDPDTGNPMATSERVLFSRFIASHDWRSIRLRSKSELQTLIAVAAPSDLEVHHLAPVDLDGEIERARASLAPFKIEVAGKQHPLTLNHLIERLRAGVDILYLVCHGAVLKKGPHLWLQDDKGAVAVISGAEFAQRIGELTQPPRLIVLASCDSAAEETDARQPDLAPLAPRLAEAGVPAIVAMQGKLTQETAARALPIFFTELSKDGQLDRALAVARADVRDRHDYWMPALYTRLRGGRIWYEPGFGEGAKDTVRWKALVSAIRSGRFTPIVGPGLSDRMFGGVRELAQNLGRRHDFPLAPHSRDDLAQVAQYLRVSQSASLARDEWKEQLRRELISRQPAAITDELASASLPKLLKATGDYSRDNNPDDPYRILATLRGAVYITANPDNLLEDALKAAGREADSHFCTWRQTNDESPRYDKQPTAERPLVYHILGHFKDEDSLVLTEDDYFDYLIGTTLNKELTPGVVGYMTANSSLLFLGFRLTDWSFRVLFRIIMRQEGGSRRADFAHVAVQVDPETDQLIDTARARAYLTDYFEKGANISLYWGSGDDFLRELAHQLTIAESETPLPVARTDADEW